MPHVESVLSSRSMDAAHLLQVLSLPALIAPVKVLVVPISSTEQLRPMVREVCRLPSVHFALKLLADFCDAALKLRKAGISSRVDDSGASIGRRYSRNDELGTPFGVTVDFASVKNGTITLRCALLALVQGCADK